jgi:hypothetical protein
MRRAWAASGLLSTFNRLVARYADPKTPTIIRTNWGFAIDHQTLGAMAIHNVEWPTLGLAAAIAAVEKYPERFGTETSPTSYRDRLAKLEHEREAAMATIDSMLRLLTEAQLLPAKPSESVVNWYRSQKYSGMAQAAAA